MWSRELRPGLNTFTTLSKLLQNTEFSKAKNLNSEDLLLDTSAQLRTDPLEKPLKTLTRRAKAKFLTNGIIFPLIDLNSPLKNSYWRTWHCTNVLLQEGHKITSRYCNNRWCIVCNRIRTAKMIEKYYPVIMKEIQDMQFVTLTFPNVKGKDLQQAISDMILNFQRIKDKIRNRDQVKIKGIRKLEVTYNPDSNNYNPHFHSLMEGRAQAEQSLREWLIRYPKAVDYAQDIRPADHNSIIELLKYTAKLINKNDYTKLDTGQVQIRIHAKALDTIFKALYRKRTYQGFGIRLKLDEDVSELKSEVFEEIMSDIDVWTWDQDNSDWISTYGEMLTGCDAHKIYQVIQGDYEKKEGKKIKGRTN
ncbi:hypothetical protein ES708_22042 [subsurface metagenome]